MTKPMEYDYFDHELHSLRSRFFAVLTDDVLVETSSETVDRVLKRGIYIFLTKKQRNAFTKLCNDAIGDTVAFDYNLKPKRKKQ